MLPDPSALVSTREQARMLIARLAEFATPVQAHALRLLMKHSPESDDERFEMMVSHRCKYGGPLLIILGSAQ